MFKLRSKQKIQEEIELDKTIKHIAYKIIQVIVQSRLGSKIRTYCKPVSLPNDCFGIAINDVPDVLTESKILLESGEPIVSNLPLSIEISLKTVDGVSLVLENWTLGINLGEAVPDNKNPVSLYNAGNLLLKSLLSNTRGMPAYKLSRTQDPNHYIIYYRIKLGEYDNSTLGTDYKTLKFGRITCRRGVLYIICKYRTNMVIPADMKTKSRPKATVIEKPKRAIDLTKPMKMGAFVNLAKIKKFEDKNFMFPENPPCAWLLDLAEKCNQIRLKKSKEYAEEKYQECIVVKLPKNRKKAWHFAIDNEALFVKPLNCAFIKDTPLSELAGFYRELYRAPPLDYFKNIDMTGNLPHEDCKICIGPGITEQLEQLEALHYGYDRLVTDVCQFSSEYI